MHSIEYNREEFKVNISNVCIIGADNRMDYIAQRFYSIDFDIYREIENSNSESLIIISPPVNEQVTKQILPYLKTGQVIYGGVVSNRLQHECELLDILLFDYLKWDHVTEANAKLTANGIIKTAISNKAVLEESNCLVTGYGFCGKALAIALKQLGANVDVMVRRRELCDIIEENGYGFVDINDKLDSKLKKYSYVFNTVPACILDSNLLDLFSKNVMIFDIASGNGGTDFEYCNSNGIFAVQNLGIPGKEYPKEAGEIIADAIIDSLNLEQLSVN